MNEELLRRLVRVLFTEDIQDTSIIPWASPVLSFGDIKRSKVATVGLNPSNLEFIDKYGSEINGPLRRFHTLKSLGISSWNDVEKNDLSKILDSYSKYFQNNPYDGWFKKLDYLISGGSSSFYFPNMGACHLDLVPFATSKKWSELSLEIKNKLLSLSGNSLGLLIRNSPIQYLLLNGKTVVDTFQRAAQVDLTETPMPEWALPRKSGEHVMGYAYEGIVDELFDVQFGRSVKVLGFNHNIQSSFGVTNEVQYSIRQWVCNSFEKQYV